MRQPFVFTPKHKSIFAILSKICYYAKKIEYAFAGGLLGVEKVKPDPLNLLVNTSVGSRYKMFVVPLLDLEQGYFNYIKYI